MLPIDSIEQTILLCNAEKYDVIKYGSDRISEDLFVVFSSEIDESIPALLLQLWKFYGGYDHSFVNIMEIDFGLNKNVKLFDPIKYKVEIDQIVSYRDTKNNMNKKEEFYFDMWPKTEKTVQSKKYSLPFRIEVNIDNKQLELILPTWTPIQQLPIDRIKTGSSLEVWQVGTTFSVMKVLKI